MDYERIIDAFISECDMRSELDRRRTYAKCVQYAEESVKAEDLNSFLQLAADKLGQQRLYKEVTSELVKSDGQERLYIRFDENEGVQLVGNPSGLLYLSRVLRSLSQAKDVGAYVYFYYNELPLCGESLPLAVYREDDAYFDDVEREDADDDFDEEPFPPRAVSPEDIAGFYVVATPPDDFGMTAMKIYRVVQWEEMQADRQQLIKESGRDFGRMVVLTFERDDNQLVRMAVDMDDPGVGFITWQDLERLSGKQGGN